jgi:hypothetical protein
VSPCYTPIRTGFTPTTQFQSQLLTDTPVSRDLSARYSEFIGQPTPSHTTVLTTTSEVSASEAAAPLMTETIEMIPSSVSLTEPP